MQSWYLVKFYAALWSRPLTQAQDRRVHLGWGGHCWFKLSKCLRLVADFYLSTRQSPFTVKMYLNPSSLPEALPMVSWWWCFWFMWLSSCIIWFLQFCLQSLHMQTVSALNDVFSSSPYKFYFRTARSRKLKKKKGSEMQNICFKSCNHT